MSIDPYHTWLGIPPEEQPPTYYRLLGISPHETNADVIANAADRQMIFVRQFQVGEHQAESQRLLNELAAAKLCLLSSTARADYDLLLQGGEVVPPPVVELPQPFNESDLKGTQPRKVGRDSHIKIRVMGHILAPIIGLGLGWIILQYLRPDSQESTAFSEQAEVIAEVQAAPEDQRIPKNDPFDLPPDGAIPTQEPTSQPTSVPKEVETPVKSSPPSKANQIVSLNEQLQEAVAKGDLLIAIRMTDQLAALEGNDGLASKLALLEQFTGRAEPTFLVNQCLSVVDAAADRSDKPIAKRAAEIALSTARQADDSILVRRATLSVLKAQSVSADPNPPVTEDALPSTENAIEAPDEEDMTSDLLKEIDGGTNTNNMLDNPPLFYQGESYQFLLRLTYEEPSAGTKTNVRRSSRTIVHQLDGQCRMLGQSKNRWPCTVTDEEVRWTEHGKSHIVRIFHPEVEIRPEGQNLTTQYLITPVVPVPNEYFENKP